jgi:hypothetical protein
MRQLTSLKRSLDAALVVMLATVGVGLAVAVAQVVQGPLVLAIVLAASVVWLLSPAGALLLVVKHRRGRLVPDRLTAVGAIAALVGAANLTLLGTLRAVTGRTALVWDIDWRYHLNHAQTIARFGDLGTALDYLGTDVHYPVGPAWIAGAFQYFTGWGLAEVSFIAVPLMTAVVTFAGGAFVCTRLGTSARAAVVAAGVLLVVPALNTDWSWVLGSPMMSLRHPSAYQFSASFILNGQLGWSVGIASVALLATTRPRFMAAGSVGLAAVAAAKPQYFLGFMVVAAAVGTVLTVAEKNRSSGYGRRFAMSLVVAGVGGLLLLLTQGGAQSALGTPVFRPFATGLGLTKFRSTALAVFILCAVAALVYRRARRVPVLRAAILLGVCAGTLIAVLSVVQVPFRPESLARARAIGLTWREGFHQGNVAQSLDPIILVGALFALAGLATLLPRLHPRGSRVTVLVGCIAALAPVPLIITAARFPTGQSAHEAVEDRGLQEVLASAPIDGSVIVVSDLADPAQDHARSLRSPILTGYGGHQFVIANLAYANYDEPDATQRLASVQRFFGSNGWSSWHTQFTEHFGVTHVLVNDRCPPNWKSWPQGLEIISSSGAWTLAKVETRHIRGQPDIDDEVRWRPLTARYGVAPCLRGT